MAPFVVTHEILASSSFSSGFAGGGAAIVLGIPAMARRGVGPGRLFSAMTPVGLGFILLTFSVWVSIRVFHFSSRPWFQS
jgi:hypothetical protein